MPGAVSVQLSKASEWGSGYEGVLSIANGKPYTILAWKLALTFADNYTWGFTEFDTAWAGNTLYMDPRDGVRRIPANSTLRIGFGGLQYLPYGPVFAQILPLEDHAIDPSLSTRGTFESKVFAPYLDVLAWPTPQLKSGVIAATGHLFYRLAFITARVLANGTAEPAWGGVVPLDDFFFYDQVGRLVLFQMALKCAQ